jgi:hypothetical protein
LDVDSNRKSEKHHNLCENEAFKMMCIINPHMAEKKVYTVQTNKETFLVNNAIQCLGLRNETFRFPKALTTFETGKLLYEYNKMQELFGSGVRPKYTRRKCRNFLSVERQMQSNTYEEWENEAKLTNRLADAKEEVLRRRVRRSLRVNLVSSIKMKLSSN